MAGAMQEEEVAVTLVEEEVDMVEEEVPQLHRIHLTLNF